MVVRESVCDCVGDCLTLGECVCDGDCVSDRDSVIELVLVWDFVAEALDDCDSLASGVEDTDAVVV